MVGGDFLSNFRHSVELMIVYVTSNAAFRYCQSLRKTMDKAATMPRTFQRVVVGFFFSLEAWGGVIKWSSVLHMAEQKSSW